MDEVKTQSIGEILSEAQGKDAPATPDVKTPETSEVVEKLPEPVAAETKGKAPEADTVAPAASPAVPPSVPTAPPPGYVPIAALQETRAKLRAAQDKLNQYEPEVEPQPAAPSMGADPRWTAFTEAQARRELPDYDDKFAAFSSEVFDAQTGTVKNEALYHSVMNSLNPAMAAYEAGSTLQLYRRHNTTDIRRIIEAERAQAVKDAEPKWRERFQAEIDGKLKLRNLTPTNISETRAASGGAPAEWRTPTFADELRRIKKGK